jgi:hypothetical protein
MSSGAGTERQDDLAVYRTILETLSGPRVVWRRGEPTVDMSAYDRPFAPAVTPAGGTLVARRRTA